MTLLARLLIAACELFQPDARAASLATATVVEAHAAAPCSITVAFVASGRRLRLDHPCHELPPAGRRVLLERKHRWSRWRLDAEGLP